MGRLIGWLLGVPFAAVAIVFAVSNRAPVVVDLWPLPWAVQAPLYLFVLAALAIGFLVGGLVAWVNSLAVRRRIRAESRAEIAAVRRQAATASTPASPSLPAPPPI